MKEMEFQLTEGSLYYEGRLDGNGNMGLLITRYHGLASHVEIPDELPLPGGEGDDALPEGGAVGQEEGGLCIGRVIGIEKKAFLSKKYLRSVTVPASVKEVGDWAFAYCDALREVTFEGREASFGRAVFMECPGLRCVRFGREETCDGVGALMAAAVTIMESAYLLDPREAGSKEWLGKWDARMLAILNAADDEGYAKQILCGEEDYESADLDTYLTGSRKKKVRLLLLRLLWPMGLSEEVAQKLRQYLLAHTKGCKTEETWQVVREEYRDRREFYQLFAELGCLTKENAPAVISETPGDAPEMKAFFLKYQAQHFANLDFFGNLEL